MGKSKARMIVASETVAPLIDRGAQVDNDLKNLSTEDKAIKAVITATAAKEFNDDTTICLRGKVATADVTAVEKYSLEGTPEQIKELTDLALTGATFGAVKVNQTLQVPPADLKRAVELLNANGINASLLMEPVVVPAEYRAFRDNNSAVGANVSSVRLMLAMMAKQEVSYRVKYGQL